MSDSGTGYKTTNLHSLPLTVPLTCGAGGAGSGGRVCGKVVPVKTWDAGMGCTLPPCGYSQPSQTRLYSQTEDKEFDDLEERFHWVSLCVTELKNNVAAYLDNLEVRILQLIRGGMGWVPQT